ncbi:prenyl diphosphate phosphatase [Coprinopsis sp. MPI-PUGE-AT-0042]|nr:prenyl diphosphate phosphatase [Coprinopsis sp. MPI-PUGE-AT-0042]
MATMSRTSNDTAQVPQVHNATNDKTGTRHHLGGQKFRLGSWLRLHGVDIITMACLGAIALGIYQAGPAPSRSFAVFNTDGSIMDPSISWPELKEIIPIWLAAFLAFSIPFVFITLFQIRRRSIDDWMTTIMGLLKSLITAATFQVFVKWLIGGLRPHFLSVCKPRISPTDFSGQGFHGGYFNRSICTGDPHSIDRAMQSMPSGHSTAAWAGLFYLFLYFNAQLKVTAAHNPAYWKMVMLFAPLLGAFLISSALEVDKHHHWYDLVVGAMIGSANATIAFRQTFASIWDYRFNHILLPRATSLFHRHPVMPSSERGAYYNYQGGSDFSSTDLPFAREGGWDNTMVISNAAPGDATAASGAGGFSSGHNTSMGYGGAPHNNMGLRNGHHTGHSNDPNTTTGFTGGHNAV